MVGMYASIYVVHKVQCVEYLDKWNWITETP
jgi:hypothetical protein